MTSDLVRIVMKENIEKAGKSDLSMFAKNLRRAEEYDNEECPERWKRAIDHIKQNGWDARTLLLNFCEPDYCQLRDDLERIIGIHNYAIKNGAVSRNLDDGDFRDQYSYSGSSGYVAVSLIARGFKPEMLDQLQSKNFAKTEYGNYVTLRDKISGFSVVFVEEPTKHRESVNVFGLPDEKITGGEKEYGKINCYAFKIGDLSLHDFRLVGQRRFMNIFGMQPANYSDITDALVELNKLPKKGKKDDEKISYALEERELKNLKHSRGIKIIYDEALDAKAKGLFSDVKIYELVGTKSKLAKPDPVIVGIDHFTQNYPIVYWAGDKGLEG